MKYEFELTRRIELSKRIEIKARSKEEAEAKVLKEIEDGLADFLIAVPDEWEIAEDDTGYDGPLE